jgi:hypothetical protein
MVPGILRVLVGCFVVAGAVYLRGSQVACSSVLQMLACFLVMLPHGLLLVFVICCGLRCVQSQWLLSDNDFAYHCGASIKSAIDQR